MVEPEVNALGQPIGFEVAGWTPPPRPPRLAMIGRTCRVEPLDPPRHGAQLHAAHSLDADGRNWPYLPYGPFATLDSYTSWLTSVAAGDDPMFHAIVDLASGDAVGVASYLRIDPAAGSIEVGHINYSPKLQRTVAATEAMYLMMKRAFGLGYRRYGWECRSVDAPSAALKRRPRDRRRPTRSIPTGRSRCRITGSSAPSPALPSIRAITSGSLIVRRRCNRTRRDRSGKQRRRCSSSTRRVRSSRRG